MLLNSLTKEDKINFINLLRLLLLVDGEESEIEKQIQKKFKYEMGDDVLKYRPSNVTKKSILDYFNSKSQITKNIAYVNLFSASLVDEWYNIEEHLLLEEVQHSFGINEKKKRELMKLVYAERDLNEKAKRIVSND